MKTEIHPFFFRTLWFVLALFSGLIAFISGLEYYNVAIENNITAYHFGSEGPYADFGHYKTPDAYARKMIVDCAISASIFLLLLVCAVKRSSTGLIILTAISIGFWIFLAI